MKKLTLGISIFLILLGLGGFFSLLMPRIHDPVAESFRLAGDFAETGDWGQARAAFYQGKDRWERFSDLTAMVCDHAPQEELEAEMALAEGYLLSESEEFPPLCRKLSAMAESISDLHSIALPHLF